jgi:cation transport regulator ChaC
VSQPGRLGLFAYGSLVNPAGAERTLGRPVELVALARLAGWRRRWSTVRDNLTSEKTFARRSGGELFGHVLGLNLEPSEERDEAPNGAIIALTEAELRRLDVREMRYDRIEVTGHLELPPGLDRVFAYRAKPAHHAPEPPDGAVAIATYVEAVEAAFAALGGSERKLYLATTGPPPVEVVDAVLIRDRVPPGNPREW